MLHSTGQVILRDMNETDLPTFYEQQTDPAATRMADFPTSERGHFMAHWRRILNDASIVKKTILVDGQIAGNMVCFELMGERDVGYWLGRAYWGKGIATEALTQFLPMIDERPLYARTAKHNIGSQRVLEKCGFKRVGEEMEEYIFQLE